MSLNDLLRGAKETAATADQLGAQFARELSAVLCSLERKLTPLVQDISEGKSRSGRGTRTAIIKGAQANRARKAIEAALTASGYGDLASVAYGARLDRLVDRVLATRRIAQAAARLSGAFDARLAALLALHETDLLDEGDEIARALWQATVRGIFGSRPVNRILADLADVIDASEAQIGTLYDTSVSIFGRQVEALQAGDDPDTAFLYVGPNDKKTRPFCREHVGLVYTRDRIDELDNWQIDNVFLTGGGYNCRHQFIEVSQFSSLQEYVNTGERVPEFESQVDEAA